MISFAEKLSQCIGRQIIIHEVKGDIGVRCLLSDIGIDFLEVKFRDGKVVVYNVLNIISVEIMPE